MTATTQPELNALASAIALMDTPETTAPMKLEATKVLARIDLQAVALARFGDWREHVADLVEKHGSVAFDLSTVKKLDEAKEVRRQIRDVRIGADKISKALKTQLRAISTSVGEEAEAVALAVKGVEAHVHEQIEAEETRKAEAATKERERKAAHELNLARIRGYVDLAKDKTSDEIAQAIQFVQDNVAIDDTWEEFKERGTAALAETLDALRELRDTTAEKERQTEEAEKLRRDTEAKALEVKTVGAIQQAAMGAFGKRATEIERVATDLQEQHGSNENPQVQVALQTTLATLNMMAIAAKQQEQMLADVAPVEAANIVAKAEAIVATASQAPITRIHSRAFRPASKPQEAAPAAAPAAEAEAAREELAAGPADFDDMDDDSDVIDVTASPAAAATAAVSGDASLTEAIHEVEIAQTLTTEGEEAGEVEIDEVTLTTHELNIRLGLHVPFAMLVGTGATLRQNEAGEDVWLASDFNLIVDSLIEHLESLKGKH